MSESKLQQCHGCGNCYPTQSMIGGFCSWKCQQTKSPSENAEQVNHPDHYGGDTIYETIKVIRAWFTPEQYRGFLLGNVIKYLSRSGKKGSTLLDQQKSMWYLEELNKYEKENDNNG